MKIISGLGMEDLTDKVCKILGVEPGKFKIHRFPDGEFRPQLLENVRGKEVFIIQSTHTHDNIIALLLTIHALKLAPAGRIIPVIPYFGYGRQERKDRPRVPISAALLAKFITVAGATDVVCVDLHADAIEGFFFDVPCAHLRGSFVLIPALKDIIQYLDCDPEKLVVVAPDRGRFQYNSYYAKKLGIRHILYCGKQKFDEETLQYAEGAKDRKKEVTFVEGQMPKDAVCFMCDDMIDTGGTLTNAAFAIKERGAKFVFSSATHPVLSFPSLRRIHEAPLDKLYVTDTIPLGNKSSNKIVVQSIAPVLAEAIKRIFSNESISELFEDYFNGHK